LLLKLKCMTSLSPELYSICQSCDHSNMSHKFHCKTFICSSFANCAYNFCHLQILEPYATFLSRCELSVYHKHDLCGHSKTLSWRNCISTSRFRMAEESRLNSKCSKLLKDWRGNINMAYVWYFKSSNISTSSELCTKYVQTVNTLVIRRTMWHKNRRWLPGTSSFRTQPLAWT